MLILMASLKSNWSRKFQSYEELETHFPNFKKAIVIECIETGNDYDGYVFDLVEE